jgi:hypothetical protein
MNVFVYRKLDIVLISWLFSTTVMNDLGQQRYDEKVALIHNIIGDSMIKDLVHVMVDYLTLLGMRRPCNVLFLKTSIVG